jgi:Na+:H+ antiporter, NhaC family
MSRGCVRTLEGVLPQSAKTVPRSSICEEPVVQEFAAARTTGRLFLAVFICAFGLNVVAGDQDIALVLPTKIFRAELARRGLAPTDLSRLAADSGTVTSPLVPWNSCGAFMRATLGVSRLLYLPYAVFC